MEAESNNCWHAYSQLQLYLMYILSLLPYTANSKDLVSEMEYIQRALNQITKDDAAAESSKNLNLWNCNSVRWFEKAMHFFLFIFP